MFFVLWPEFRSYRLTPLELFARTHRASFVVSGLGVSIYGRVRFEPFSGSLMIAFALALSNLL